MTDFKRLRGLKALVQDVVEHGSTAVQRVHLETAARPFVILELIPGIAAPAHTVRQVHDLYVSGVYGTIRAVNRVVGKTLDVALDVAEGTRRVNTP